jgi:hypothetical protein
MRDSTSAASAEATSAWYGLIGRVHRWADDLAGFLARYQYVFLGLASVAYFVITCYRAHRRLFWFDEIFTFYVARLPDAASIWNSCLHGADFNPPLIYLFARWSQELFGVTELGMRIPQILGFWVFCVCLYRFVSIRTSALAGFLALLFPLTTEAYWYAYDARSHGAVLGFFGLALISWQAAADRAPRRWLSPLLLAVSLTGAALCHAYAFLLFIPIAVGELTRSIVRRRFDTLVWAALLIPAVVSGATIFPLLHAIGGFVKPGLFTTPLKSLWMMWELSAASPLILPFFLLLVVPAVWPSGPWFRGDEAKSDRKGWSFAWHEFAALWAIFFTPPIAFAAARLNHAPLFGRYTLIVAGAVACLSGAALARSSAAGLLALLMTVLVIGNGFTRFRKESLVMEPSTGSAIPTRPEDERATFEWLASAAPGADPIVLLDFLEFAPLFHYATPSILPRLIYLDPGFDRPDVNAEGYARLQRYGGAPGAIALRSEFLAGHRSFFAYGPFARIDVFRELGGNVTVRSCGTRNCIFRVVMAAAQ